MKQGNNIEQGLAWWATLTRTDKAPLAPMRSDTGGEIDADLRSPDPDVRMAAGIAAVGDAWSSFRKASIRSR
jgi:hypothetical protein